MNHYLPLKWLMSLTTLLLFTSILYAQSLPPYKWATRGGSTGATAIEETRGIGVDAAGNVYTAGTFPGTANFGPFPLTTAGSTDMFVAKQDGATGSYLWIKQFGGTSGETAYDLELDASGGIVFTGTFGGTVDFDPGPGAFNLSTGGATDNSFICKLDADGNFVWAKAFEGPGNVSSLGLAIDASGSVYSAGLLSGTADFDPGAGTFNMTSIDGPLDDRDTYVCKLDASGIFVWARRIGGSSEDFAQNVAVDAANNVYITGFFIGTVDFDPGPGVFNLTSLSGGGGANDRDAFFCKLDASGNFLWALRIGTTTPELARDINVDASSGNVYATGSWNNGAQYYIIKISAAGTILWTRTMGSGQGYRVLTDAAGYVYTSGHFSGTADFDPGAGTVNRTAGGSMDAFIHKLDANGNFVDVIQIGGSTSDLCYALAVSSDGTSVYGAGRFGSTTDFDPSAGTASLTATGVSDHFTIKLSSVTLPATLLYFDVSREGPIAELNWATASEQNNKSFEILHSADGSHYDSIGKVFSLAPGGNSNRVLQYRYTDQSPAPGSNFYRLKQEDADGRVTYSPVRHVLFDSLAIRIKLYPNPATNFVSLSGLQGGETITMHTATGIRITARQVTTASARQQVSLMGISKGIYFLRVQHTTQKVELFKLIVE